MQGAVIDNIVEKLGAASRCQRYPARENRLPQESENVAETCEKQGKSVIRQGLCLRSRIEMKTI